MEHKKLDKIEKEYMKNLDRLSLEQRKNHDTIIARSEIFTETRRLSGKKTDVIVIDDNNQLFYHLGGDKAEWRVFTPIHKFSEVISYENQNVIEQKQIVETKKKGGIGRAVVGGALFGVAGAVVGASTAKTDTTVTNVEMLKGIELHVKYGGELICNDIFKNAAPGTREFLDACIAIRENGARNE